MRMLAWLTGVCVSAIGAMPMAQNVSYKYDRSASFATYRTYAWTRGAELPDQASHASVVRGVDAALTAKGYVQVDEAQHTDLFVAYHASFETSLEWPAGSRGADPFGAGPDHRWHAPGVRTLQVGTLVVDVTDARSDVIVWRSLARGPVGANDSPETREKKINMATAKMFRNFPKAR